MEIQKQQKRYSDYIYHTELSKGGIKTELNDIDTMFTRLSDDCKCIYVNKNNTITNQLSKKQYANAGLDLKCDLSKPIQLYSKLGLITIEDPDLEEIILPPFNRIVLNTSINVAIPHGYVGLVWDRSGMAASSGITVLAGCIDSGYTGDVKVVLYNTSCEEYIIHNHDRIAQLLTVPVNLNIYQEVPELENTTRGCAGFGSSGR